MNNDKEKNEILTSQDEKLRVLCGSLKQVEAPKDFDFKLKSRIARTKSSDFQRRFGFAFRYALPALLLILVSGLFAYNSGIFSSSGNNSLVASGEVPPVNQPQPQSAPTLNISPSTNTVAANVNTTTVIPDTPKTPEKIQPQQIAAVRIKQKDELTVHKKNEGGGSKLSSLTSDQTRQPKNINQLILPKNLQNEEKANPISVKEVLSANGINAEVENGQWKVKSVTPNSLAESSGLKENDLIEAIDDQKLSAGTVFSKTVSGKTITVTRGGEKMTIKLQNK